MGQSPPGETYNKERIGLPFFQGKKDFGILYPEAKVWCSAPKIVAEPNDILICVRAPVGPTNIAKERCCIGRGLAALRCKDGLSYRYLIWVLRNFEKKISSEGAGSVFDAIGKDDITSIKFPLPPTVEEQNIIADELAQKMKKVENLRTSIAKQFDAVSSMQGAILRDYFDFNNPKKKQ